MYNKSNIMPPQLPYTNLNGVFISTEVAKQFFRRLKKLKGEKGKVIYGGWVERSERIDNIIGIISTHYDKDKEKIFQSEDIFNFLKGYDLYLIIKGYDIHIKSYLLDNEPISTNENQAEEENHLIINNIHKYEEEEESVSELLEKSRLLRKNYILKNTPFYTFYKEFKIKTKHEHGRAAIMAYYLAEEYTEEIKNEVNILCNLRTTINAIDAFNKQNAEI